MPIDFNSLRPSNPTEETDNPLSDVGAALNRGVVGGIYSLARMGQKLVNADTSGMDAALAGIADEKQENQANLGTGGRIVSNVAEGVGSMAATLPVDILSGGATRVGMGLEKFYTGSKALRAAMESGTAINKMSWMPGFAVGMGETGAIKGFQDNEDSILSKIASAAGGGVKGLAEGMIFHQAGSMGKNLSPMNQYIAQTLGIQPAAAVGVNVGESVLSGHGMPGIEELATSAGSGMVIGGGMGLAGARNRHKMTADIMGKEREALDKGFFEIPVNEKGEQVSPDQAIGSLKFPYTIANTQANMAGIKDRYIRGRLGEVADEYKDSRPEVTPMSRKDFANIALDIMNPGTETTPESAQAKLEDLYNQGKLYPQDLLMGDQVAQMSHNEMIRSGQTRAHESEVIAQQQLYKQMPGDWWEGQPGKDDYTTAEKGLKSFEDIPIEEDQQPLEEGHPLAQPPVLAKNTLAEVRDNPAAEGDVEIAKSIVDNSMKPSTAAAVNTSIDQERAVDIAGKNPYEGKVTPVSLEDRNPELAAKVDQFFARGDTTKPGAEGLPNLRGEEGSEYTNPYKLSDPERAKYSNIIGEELKPTEEIPGAVQDVMRRYGANKSAPADVNGKEPKISLVKEISSWEDIQKNAKRLKVADDIANASDENKKTITDTVNGLPESDAIAHLAWAGRAAKDWYNHDKLTFDALFGKDSEQFSDLVAALSPQNHVRQNIYHALAIWRAYKASGEPLADRAAERARVENILRETTSAGWGGEGYKARWDNSVRAFMGEDLHGPKVSEFGKNTGGDPSAVTIDIWMSLIGDLMGYKKDRSGIEYGSTASSNQIVYNVFSDRIQQAAKQLGWKPSEVQAAIWGLSQSLYYKMGSKTQTRQTTGQEALSQLTNRDVAGATDYTTYMKEAWDNKPETDLFGEPVDNSKGKDWHGVYKGLGVDENTMNSLQDLLKFSGIKDPDQKVFEGSDKFKNSLIQTADALHEVRDRRDALRSANIDKASIEKGESLPLQVSGETATDQLSTLPYKHLVSMHNEIFDTAFGRSGVEGFARKFGIDVLGVVHGPGGWVNARGEKQHNPSFQIEIATPQEGIENNPVFKKNLEAFVSALGTIFNQDGMSYTRPIVPKTVVGETLGDLPVMMVDMKRGHITRQETQQLWDALLKNYTKDQFYINPTSEGMLISQIKGEDGKYPISYKEFADTVKEHLDNIMEGKVKEIKLADKEGDYLDNKRNDKEVERNGNYSDKITQGGRPGIEADIRASGTRTTAIQDRYSDQYGSRKPKSKSNTGTDTADTLNTGKVIPGPADVEIPAAISDKTVFHGSGSEPEGDVLKGGMRHEVMYAPHGYATDSEENSKYYSYQATRGPGQANRPKYVYRINVPDDVKFLDLVETLPEDHRIQLAGALEQYAGEVNVHQNLVDRAKLTRLAKTISEDSDVTGNYVRIMLKSAFNNNDKAVTEFLRDKAGYDGANYDNEGKQQIYMFFTPKAAAIHSYYVFEKNATKGDLLRNEGESSERSTEARQEIYRQLSDIAGRDESLPKTDVGSVAPGGNVGAGGDIRTVGRALAPIEQIQQHIERQGNINFRGLKIENPADLAIPALGILRNPLFETFRIFYLKGDTIVGHEGITSRLPGMTKWMLHEPSKEGFDKFIVEKKALMDNVGADGYYLVHNHPSGYVMFSDADIKATRAISSGLPGSKGHIVIDHNTYSHVGPDGMNPSMFAFDRKSYIDELKTPSVPNSLLGREITGPTVGAKIGKELNAPEGYSVVVHTNSYNEITGIQEVSTDMIGKPEFADTLKQQAQAFGAARSFLYIPSVDYGFARNTALKDLVRSGYLTDAFLGEKGVSIGNANEMNDEGKVWGETFKDSPAFVVAEKGKGYDRNDSDNTLKLISAYLEKNASESDKTIGTMGTKPSDIPPPFTDVDKSSSWMKEQTGFMLSQAKKVLPGNHPELGAVERLLGSPEWYTHPGMQKLVDLFVHERHDLSNKIFQDNEKIDHKGVFSEENSIIKSAQRLRDKGLSRTQILKGETSLEYQKLKEIITYGDAEYKRNFGDPLEKQTADFQDHITKKLTSEGMRPDQISSIIGNWQNFRKSYDGYLNLMMAPMVKMRDNVKSIAEANGARPDIKKLEENITFLINKMNTWRGFYAPRERANLKYYIQAHKGVGDDAEYIREPVSNTYSLEKRKADLQAQGYEVTSGEQQKLPEIMFSDMKKIHMASLLRKSVQDISSSDPENALLLTKLHENILDNVVQSIQARGYLKSKMSRLEDVHVKGYEEDPIGRYTSYSRNTSSGMAKAEIAKKSYGILSEIDPKADPRGYETATNYIDWNLRNMEAADRSVQIAKSIASFKYLGVNFRSLIVNMTAVVSSVPSSIHQYALDGKVGIPKILVATGRAGADFGKYLAGNKDVGSAEDQKFLQQVMESQYDSPQYTQDVMGVVQKGGSKIWNTTMRTVMTPFMISEQWNRGTTLLSAFRLAREQGIPYDEAVSRARNATEKAHGIYGKETLPEWAQGTSASNRVGQMMYSYAKFGHNYTQLLYDLGARKGNIEAFVYALMAPVALAGTAAFPFIDNIKGAIGWTLKALGIQKDPSKWFFDKTRETMGANAEKFGRSGLLGLLGADISSSLNISGGIPKNFMELMGPFGGVVEDLSKAGKYISTGQGSKAAESALPVAAANFLKAYRESTEGVTTGAERRVFGEDNKPVTLNPVQAGMRAAGFRSSDVSMLTARKNESQNVYNMFKDEHDGILESVRAYLAKEVKDPKTLSDIQGKIKQYNDGIIKEKLQGQVSFITGQSLRTQIKGMAAPAKKERVRLGEYSRQ